MRLPVKAARLALHAQRTALLVSPNQLPDNTVWVTGVLAQALRGYDQAESQKA
jgi:hypothetical protein